MVTVTALLFQPRVGLAKSQAPVPHGANWASMGFKDITVICLLQDKWEVPTFPSFLSLPFISRCLAALGPLSSFLPSRDESGRKRSGKHSNHFHFHIFIWEWVRKRESSVGKTKSNRPPGRRRHGGRHQRHAAEENSDSWGPLVPSVWAPPENLKAPAAFELGMKAVGNDRENTLTTFIFIFLFGNG